MTEEERAIEKVNELPKESDPEAAALDNIARQYAEPFLRQENFERYAIDSNLNNLLSVPNLPRDLKKKIIAGHMTAELTKAFDGVGDPCLPVAASEIIAEYWCNKLPFGNTKDWISALNAAAENPDYEPPEPKSESEHRSKHTWGIVWAVLFALSVGYLWLFAGW
jgi:hypothetical protein